MLRKFRRFYRLSVSLAACPLLIVLSAHQAYPRRRKSSSQIMVYQTKSSVEITHNSMFKGSHYIQIRGN